MSNKLKRFGIVTGYTLLGLYVLFLALPLALSPIANSYKADVEKIVKESTKCLHISFLLSTFF